MKLARSVVTRPDGVLVHSYRDDVAGEAQRHPRPGPPPRVVRDLPWTHTPDYREHERAARLQQTGAPARHRGEVGHTIERAEIGVRTIKRAFSVQPLKLVSADRQRLHAISNRFLMRASGGTGNHVGRPVRGCYVVSTPGHANGVQASTAAEIDQPAVR